MNLNDFFFKAFSKYGLMLFDQLWLKITITILGCFYYKTQDQNETNKVKKQTWKVK